jgi:DNA polymerase III epsilon subunit-like protein
MIRPLPRGTVHRPREQFGLGSSCIASMLHSQTGREAFAPAIEPSDRRTMRMSRPAQASPWASLGTLGCVDRALLPLGFPPQAGGDPNTLEGSMSHSLANLHLLSPLIALDVATTGTSADLDRIVEIAMVKFRPAGTRTQIVRRVNPCMPISPLATLLHHISDQDVANCPPFEGIAVGLAHFLGGGDLCGSNIRRLGLPLLLAEFARAGVPFQLDHREVFDVAEFDASGEPRDLAILAIAAVLDLQMAKSSDHRENARRPAQRLCRRLQAHDDDHGRFRFRTRKLPGRGRRFQE